jgi:hypothetical protein
VLFGPLSRWERPVRGLKVLANTIAVILDTMTNVEQLPVFPSPSREKVQDEGVLRQKDSSPARYVTCTSVALWHVRAGQAPPLHVGTASNRFKYGASTASVQRSPYFPLSPSDLNACSR